MRAAEEAEENQSARVEVEDGHQGRVHERTAKVRLLFHQKR